MVGLVCCFCGVVLFVWDFRFAMLGGLLGLRRLFACWVCFGEFGCLGELRCDGFLLLGGWVLVVMFVVGGVGVRALCVFGFSWMRIMLLRGVGLGGWWFCWLVVRVCCW